MLNQIVDCHLFERFRDDGGADGGEVLLLKVEEAAKRLRLGRSLTYRLIQTGALRSIRVAGARRVPVQDLEEFVQRLRSEQAEDV